MNFIEHSLNWCRGEVFEGKMLALFGLVLLILSIVYWRFGSTPFAKAMIIPMLIVGGMFVAVGSTMVVNNTKRIDTYQAEYGKDAAGFAQSEKVRTDAFIVWYPYTRWIMAALTIIGLAAFIYVPTANGRAIGLALILFSFSALYLDHFSEERAATYAAHINAAISGR